METGPQEDFENELASCRAHISSLEERLGCSATEDLMSEDPAPGVESSLVGKLASLLSRH